MDTSAGAEGEHTSPDVVRARVEEYWREFAQPLTQFARPRIPVESDAEEVVARVFESVYRALLQGSGPNSHARAYLYAAVRHEIAREQQRHEKQAYLEDLPALRDSLVSEGGSVSGSRGLLSDVLLEFTESDRMLLYAVLGEGAKVKVVSQELGLSPAAASRRLYKIRPRFKAKWIQRHVDLSGAQDGCLPVLAQVGVVLAGIAGNTAEASFWAHVDGCPSCQARIARASRAAKTFALLVPPLALAPSLRELGNAEQAAASVREDRGDQLLPQAPSPSTWVAIVATVLGAAVLAGLMLLGRPTQPLDASSPPQGSTGHVIAEDVRDSEPADVGGRQCSWSATTLCQGPV